MWPAFPTSDYYDGSAPPRGQQPTASLPAPSGQPQDGSHVHRQPIDGGGAQLFPCSLAMSTPQTFLMASAPATKFRRRSRPPHQGGRALLLGPHPPGWSRCRAKGGSATGSLPLHLPVSLAGPEPSGDTGPSRRCRGRSRPHPALPGPGCPQLQRPAATGRRWISHSTRSIDASWRTTCSRHNPGKSQGRPKQTCPRSKRIVQNGLPGCVLPENPRPRSPDRRVRTGQQPSEDDFHAPSSRRLDWRLAHARSATSSGSADVVVRHDRCPSGAGERAAADRRRGRAASSAGVALGQPVG
jgi:hypothetical protein